MERMDQEGRECMGEATSPGVVPALFNALEGCRREAQAIIDFSPNLDDRNYAQIIVHHCEEAETLKEVEGPLPATASMEHAPHPSGYCPTCSACLMERVVALEKGIREHWQESTHGATANMRLADDLLHGLIGVRGARQ